MKCLSSAKLIWIPVLAACHTAGASEPLTLEACEAMRPALELEYAQFVQEAEKIADQANRINQRLIDRLDGLADRAVTQRFLERIGFSCTVDREELRCYREGREWRTNVYLTRLVGRKLPYLSVSTNRLVSEGGTPPHFRYGAESYRSRIGMEWGPTNNTWYFKPPGQEDFVLISNGSVFERDRSPESNFQTSYVEKFDDYVARVSPECAGLIASAHRFPEGILSPRLYSIDPQVHTRREASGRPATDSSAESGSNSQGQNRPWRTLGATRADYR